LKFTYHPTEDFVTGTRPYCRTALAALILSSAAWAQPTIGALSNNYSYTLPGLPNYGIAPGSIFVIFGTNLNSQPFSGLQSSAAPGIQTTLNGTSISVTVNGVTTQPFIYYTSATQVAAVLPSTTPVGTGTITVTNNGQTSAPAQIQVVQSAVGILTQNQGGTGQAVVEDPTNNYSNFSFTNSVKPGQLIALWGSGVGADSKDNDYLYPQNQDNLTGIPMQIYIGGISATITYRGRSQFPGLDQIFVTVPANVTPGCAVSLVISSGAPSLTGNSVSIPVAANGGACSDSFSPFTATLLETLSGKTTVNVGFLEAGQITAPSTTGGAPSTTSTANGFFYSYTQAQFDAAQAALPSLGSCVIVPPTTSSTVLPTGLDAGPTITLTGPTGQVSLTRNPVVAGYYAPGSALASSFFPSTGGTFTFTGTGGANVGAFTQSVSLASPLVWTNAASISPVNLANGVTVTWTGGAPDSYVLIYGTSSTSVSFQATPLVVTFDCVAPVSAGTFTVPPAVLQSLPAASASGLTPPTLTVENAANPVLFSASGLDLGYVTAFVSDSINVTYQSSSAPVVPQVQSISLQSSQASSGASVQGTVTLSSPASSAITVALASSSSAVTVPSSVTVAAGATSAAFTATLGAVASAQTVTITATYAAVSVQTQITVNPLSGVDSYNGTYTGTYSGSVGTTKVSGSITATANNGTLTVTQPGSGSATISASGQVLFGVDVGSGVTCNFTGTFVLTGTSASASGSFTCSNSASGTWSITD
jgi:trimeric autotransporter adhesin